MLRHLRGAKLRANVSHVDWHICTYPAYRHTTHGMRTCGFKHCSYYSWCTDKRFLIVWIIYVVRRGDAEYPIAIPVKGLGPQLIFIHIHQWFRIQYTCFELDTVNIDWWICIIVCLVLGLPQPTAVAATAKASKAFKRQRKGKCSQGGSALYDICWSSVKTLLVKRPSVQWRPDGFPIRTKKWFLGAGFLGAPPISLIYVLYPCMRFAPSRQSNEFVIHIQINLS